MNRIIKKAGISTLGLVALTVAGTITEAKANELPKEEKITKEQIATAKINFDNTTSEVAKQEGVVVNFKDEVETTKKVINKKTIEIKELEKIKKQSTEETITEAKENILKEEKKVKILESNLLDKEKVVSVAEKEKSRQTIIIEEKQKEIINIDNEVIKAEQDFKTAKETLAGTNTESVIKVLEEAKATEEKIRQELEKVKVDLAEAKKNDLQRANDIKQVTEEKRKLTTKVEIAKDSLNNENTKTQKIVTALINATKELEKTKVDVNSFNTITLTTEYISNLKKAFDFTLLSEERELARIKLKEINSEVLSLNKYKVNRNDDNVTKLDVNNLNEDIRKELSLFASELVNQIREQIGTKKTTVTNSSIEFANKIANNYKKDEWSIWQGRGHDEVAISKVASEYGLPQGQLYENLAGTMLTDKQLTYSQLKQSVYNTVAGFMLNGKEWLHAQSVAGINWGNSEEEYLGLDFSNVDRTQIHLLTISKDKVAESTKQNFSKTIISNPMTLAKLQETLNIANRKYNEKLLENRTAQQDLLNAKSVYDTKSKELRTITNKLNILLEQTELTPKVETKVQSLKIVLDTAKKDFVKAQRNYENLSSDIKIKKLIVANAEKVLGEKLDKLQIAKSVLNIEKIKLNELNNKLLEQKTSIDSIKQESEQAKNKVQQAKDYLYKLENIPELLKVAKEQLVRLEQKLSNRTELVQDKLTQLENLKLTRLELEKIYLELLNKYNKQIKEYKLQELQKQLDKIEKTKRIEYKESLVKDNSLIKEKNQTKKLLNTGSETTSTEKLGILTLILGLLGLIRKQNNA